MLSRADVVTAYQLLLGRLPESDAIVDNYVKHASFETLRATILGSAEFAGRIIEQPNLLNVDPFILSSAFSMRLATRQMEHLASLDLQLWGAKVLCPITDTGHIPNFFCDRHCRVTLADANPERIETRRDTLRRLSGKLAPSNIELRALDMSQQTEPDDKWQIVASYGATLPIRNPDRFMTGLMRSCSSLLILETKAAFGDEAEVLATRASGIEPQDVAIPTRQWLWSQLAAGMPYVYVPRTQPCHEDYPLAWRGGSQGRAYGQTVLIASRAPLDETKFSPTLLDRQDVQN